ncbi:MAG TPA: galactokinase [Cyclobacteriaceae bacterium]
MTEKIIKGFIDSFNNFPILIIQSPGRINIIGEHTDYNDGFVLPAAINRSICLAFALNDSPFCNVLALDYDQSASFKLESIVESDKQWLNYILGVTHQLAGRISGFNMAFTGDIPLGAGLSSSAALSCGVAMGLSELFGLNIDRKQLALIAQKAEHDFAHVKCGLMDQYACLFGKANHAILLDCMNLTFQKSSFDLSGCNWLLINSNVSHQLDNSAYNDRRIESKRAIEEMRQHGFEINSYRAINESMLKKAEADISPMLWKRANHIVTENNRVHKVSEALGARNFEKVGAELINSHLSLREDYEVTCRETDFLVKELTKEKTVYGARQIGGGFGGCILALAKDNNTSELLNRLDSSYSYKFNKAITHIPVEISDGCHVV